MRHFILAVFFAPILLLAAVLLTSSAFAQSEEDEEESVVDHPKVPITHDLTTIAHQSEQRLVPIILMFSAEDCDYCERLEEDIIRPMLLSGDFDRRAIFRKVMVDSFDQLKDFSGADTDAEDFANGRDIQVTPTLAFFDAKGNQLAPKVVGYQTGALYMAYLDVAIDASKNYLVKQASKDIVGQVSDN